MSNKSFTGFLSMADYFLFNVYSSFALLHFAKPFPDSKNQYVQELPESVLKHSSDLDSKARFPWLYIPAYKGKQYEFTPSTSFSYYLFARIPGVYVKLFVLLRDKFFNKFNLKFPKKLNRLEKCLIFLFLVCLIVLGVTVVRYPIPSMGLLLFGVLFLRKFPSRKAAS